MVQLRPERLRDQGLLSVDAGFVCSKAANLMHNSWIQSVIKLTTSWLDRYFGPPLLLLVKKDLFAESLRAQSHASKILPAGFKCSMTKNS